MLQNINIRRYNIKRLKNKYEFIRCYALYKRKLHQIQLSSSKNNMSQIKIQIIILILHYKTE